MTARAAEPPLHVIRTVAERIFRTPQQLGVERMMEGGSTFVYRVTRGAETFYLRVLPEVGDSFAPEVRVHQILRARGVIVPDVIYFEHRDAQLGCSVMATTEIPGCPVGRTVETATVQSIMFSAGQQLALLNSTPVAGFGWIKRDSPSVVVLEADHRSHRDFMQEYFDQDISVLETRGLLTPKDVSDIRALSSADQAQPRTEQATLAHGDFDVTHIFQQRGRYTGLIDFGEIRGTDPWYDLGHFRVHDGAHLPMQLLPSLVAGYKVVRPLPPDYMQRICIASVFIAVRAWARSLGRRPRQATEHPARTSIIRDLAALRA